MSNQPDLAAPEPPPTVLRRLGGPAGCVLSLLMIAGAGYWLLSGSVRIFMLAPCTAEPALLFPLSAAVFFTLPAGALLLLFARSRPWLALAGILPPVLSLAGWAIVGQMDAARQAECQSRTLEQAMRHCNADPRHFVRGTGDGYVTVNLRTDAGFDAYACLDRWERFQRGIAIGLDPEFFRR